MRGDVAIRCQGLGKQYRLGPRQRYRALRDTLPALALAPFRGLRSAIGFGRPTAQGATLWALRDVSFEVSAGEIVGIIGANGAGKSTLLKILSRITEPTEGQAEIHGRVGSLLEVGTGFHPELTGRENVYLNGAILGMRKAEIEAKFDEIVAFAEVERFVDAPVKHYSSGMYVRLAFAVAAHLDPEIMLIDEVLAVGDARFQRKCVGKIGDSVRTGRTVFFVSHNMVAVQNLCTRVIWLDGGRIVDDGDRRVIARYAANTLTSRHQRSWPDVATAPGGDAVRVTRASVRPAAGSGHEITTSTELLLEFEYWNLGSGAHLNLSLHVYDEQGVLAFNTAPVNEAEWHGRAFPQGRFLSACRVPGDLLNEGVYRIELLVVKDQATVLYRDDGILVFEVRDAGQGRGAWYGRVPGVVRPNLEWRTTCLERSEAPAGAGR